MALPEFIKASVEKALTAYCSRKVPAHVSDRLKVNFRFRGNNVTLFESRPYFLDQSKWIDSVVAQFRYDPENGTWSLYCADRNSRWHAYSHRPQKNSRNFFRK